MEEILRQLAATNADDTKGLILYALFQKKVMEDDFGALENSLAIKRQEESRNFIKKRWEKEERDYALESNATVIVVSGNRESIGTVLDANYEIRESLGYEKNELVGESVNAVIPEVIATHHNAYIEKYFETREDSNVNSVISKLVLPQHAKGHLVPCSIFIRLVPNLENGAQFLSFLSIAKDISGFRPGDTEIRTNDVFIFLLNEAFEIVSFCKNFLLFCCGEECNAANLKRYLENKEKITVRNAYNFLFTGDNREAMSQPEGLTLTIDLGPLKASVSSEIIDSYDSPAVEHFVLGRSDDVRLPSKDSGESVCLPVNVKLHTVTHSTNLGKHHVLSMLLLERCGTVFVEQRSESTQLDRQENRNVKEGKASD